MFCIGDINSFDDLLVGAPMYSETHYERGAVHVYVNDGEVTFVTASMV